MVFDNVERSEGQGSGSNSSIHYEATRISNARSSLSESESIINEYYDKVINSSEYIETVNSQNFIQKLAPELNSLKTKPNYIKFNIARNMGLPFTISMDFLNKNIIGLEASRVIDNIYFGCLARNQFIKNGEFEKAEIVAEKIDYYMKHCTISGFSEYLAGTIESIIKEDIKGGARQVVLGNYYDNVTLSGTIGQVLTSVLGVDLPGDIRDISYDIKNWEWSKQHGIQFALDMVSILPVVGVLKYGDEAKDLVKGGKVATKFKAIENIKSALKTEPERVFENVKSVSSNGDELKLVTTDDIEISLSETEVIGVVPASVSPGAK